MKKMTFGLCKGRHDLPSVDGYVYPENVDPTDIEGLLEVARFAIPIDCTEVSLYVTGLTPATLAVVRACYERKIKLTCYHWNRDTMSYFPQVIL